jgi:hypothetical protein
MTSGQIEELRVDFDPGPTQASVLRWRRLVRGRIIGAVLTVLVLAALYLWRGEDAAGPGTLIVYAVIIGLSLVWLLVYLLIYRRAKKYAATVKAGTAICIDRRGVEVAGVVVPWPEVAGIAAVPARWGRSPRLQVTRHHGDPLSVPFDHMDVRPATLDMTARAYSAGRHGVDLQALDA